jgi:hypothetical protein
MTKLRITDPKDSCEDDDSGCEMGDDGDALFLGSICKGKGKRLSLGKPPSCGLGVNKGKAKEEVAEAIHLAVTLPNVGLAPDRSRWNYWKVFTIRHLQR